MKDRCFIVYRADDPYELPVALCDTIKECATFCRSSRDEIYDSIKFGDVIHGYKVDAVNDDTEQYSAVRSIVD